MISLDLNNEGGSVDLGPVYNMILQLSSNKLDSTDYVKGFDYLVDYSDGTALNSKYMYNITGDISGLNSDSPKFEIMNGFDMNIHDNEFGGTNLSISGMSMLSQNTFGTFLTLELKGENAQIRSNSLGGISTLRINCDILGNNSIGGVYTFNQTCYGHFANWYHNIGKYTHNGLDAGSNTYNEITKLKMEDSIVQKCDFAMIDIMYADVDRFFSNTMFQNTYMTGIFNLFRDNSISSIDSAYILNGNEFTGNTFNKGKYISYDCMSMRDTLNTVSYVDIHGFEILPSIYSGSLCNMNGVSISSGTLTHVDDVNISGYLLSSNNILKGHNLNIQAALMASNTYSGYYKCKVNGGDLISEYFYGMRSIDVSAISMDTCIFENCYTAGITGDYGRITFSNVDSVNIDRWHGTVGWGSVKIFNFNSPEGLLFPTSQSSSKFIDSVTNNIPSSLIRIGGLPVTYVFH
jgi:hypothetical protein